MKNNENVSYTQSHITDALLKLMTTHEFENITITDIVNEAGVGRASFYRNYTSKEDVLKKHLLRLLKEWGTDFEVQCNPDWLTSLLWHFYNHKDLYILLYKSDLSHLILENIRAISGPKPEQDNMHAYFSAFFCGGLFGWIDEWIKRDMKETPDEIMVLSKELHTEMEKTSKKYQHSL